MSRGRYVGDTKGGGIGLGRLSPPMRTCSMCREKFDIACGRDPPRMDRSSRRFERILLILLLFCTSHGSNIRGNGTPDVYRILGGTGMRQEDYDYSHVNEIKDDDRQRDLYIGHSGDPWSDSAVHNVEEDFYVRVSSSVNATVNSTRTKPLATGRKENHARFKRGVVHLYNMVVCATGCNPLAYKGYGCYCGFLGSGYVIDGIDQCCKMHDWCYDATDCPMFSEYFVPYYWRCYRGYKPVCAIEHGDWGGSGSCAQRLCECDRSLAECLRRYPCPTTKAVCTSSPWRLVQNLFMII